MRLTLRTLIAWLDDTLTTAEVKTIGQQVADVLDGLRPPAETIPALMLRSAKPEFHGLEGSRRLPREQS